MKIDKLEILLKKDEGKDIDFKREVSMSSEKKINKESLIKDICAIANSVENIGWLIFGIEDKTKNIIGIKKELEEEKIQRICPQYISPPVELLIENIPYKDKLIGVITIRPTYKPHQTKKDSGDLKNSKIYIRRGSTNDEATPDEIRMLYASRASSSYESNLICENSFDGVWNEEKAKLLVQDKLKNHKWSEYYSSSMLDITDYKIFYLPHFLKKDSYLIIAPNSGSECHACHGTLSIFEFTNINNSWCLSSSQIEAINAGSYGESPESKLIEIGKDRFGVLFEEPYCNQGIMCRHISIYCNIGGKYKLIFNEEISYHSPGEYGNYESRDSLIEIEKKGGSFYDIILIKNGQIVDDNNELQIINEKIRYKFDGISYSTSDFYF